MRFYSHQVGRPPLLVNIEQVELLRGSGFSWREVAQIVGVSRTTIWRILQDLGITPEKYSDICDTELDSIVQDIYHGNPNIGTVMLQGYMSSRGIKIQRQRIRDSVFRINPNRVLRWQQAIQRRSYSVPGPNALWHIDGHHSLIRLRLVVHGGVDGFSRMITFLAASTNNKATTVYDLFMKGTQEFGTPSRVRSDKGGENTLVCHFMISQRGPGCGSHIAGSSVHNQRIERMWRDVYRCVCCSFHEVFLYLESQNLLDPSNEIEIFVLHCVFLPILNDHVSGFARAWNHHPIRTERNWSPKKMWVNGMIDPNRRNQAAVQDVVVNGTIADYGIDDYGPLPELQAHTVDVPETLSSVPDRVKEEFVDILQDVSNIGEAVIEYTRAKEILYECLCRDASSDDGSSSD